MHTLTSPLSSAHTARRPPPAQQMSALLHVRSRDTTTSAVLTSTIRIEESQELPPRFDVTMSTRCPVTSTPPTRPPASTEDTISKSSGMIHVWSKLISPRSSRAIEYLSADLLVVESSEIPPPLRASLKIQINLPPKVEGLSTLSQIYLMGVIPVFFLLYIVQDFRPAVR